MMSCLNIVLCNLSATTLGNDLFQSAGSDGLTKILQLGFGTCCGVPVNP